MQPIIYKGKKTLEANQTYYENNLNKIMCEIEEEETEKEEEKEEEGEEEEEKEEEDRMR